MKQRSAIVLAAGKGTRMKSDLPKVLFPVCGRPMLHYVVDALRKAGVGSLAVVVGYRADLVRQSLEDVQDISFVEQTEQLGTGHAVQVCGDWLADRSGGVLVVAGDSPLIQSDSVENVFTAFEASEAACFMGTLHKEDPTGLGRIVRDDEGQFAGIVEHKDASEEQLKITEVNMSTYVFDCGELRHSLKLLTNDNQQGEYYLTDCPGILRREGKNVQALPVLKPCESLSINTVDELGMVEAEMKKLGY